MVSSAGLGRAYCEGEQSSLASLLDRGQKKPQALTDDWRNRGPNSAESRGRAFAVPCITPPTEPDSACQNMLGGGWCCFTSIPASHWVITDDNQLPSAPQPTLFPVGRSRNCGFAPVASLSIPCTTGGPPFYTGALVQPGLSVPLFFLYLGASADQCLPRMSLANFQFTELPATPEYRTSGGPRPQSRSSRTAEHVNHSATA